MTKDEVMKLAVEHNIDGCLSHNLRIVAFANAIANAQREKDAQICLKVHHKRTNDGSKIGYNAIMDCVDAIRKEQ